MKRIQKGFTLIELMIVVAIIGILAAVAIPAYQDYIVKSKLSKVQSTLDPIKLAIGEYFQEQGAFPVQTTALNALQTSSGSAFASGTINVWTSLGISASPTLPPEVYSISYISDTNGDNFALGVTFQNIKVTTVNGLGIAICPTSKCTVTGAAANPVSTSVAPVADTTPIPSGVTALSWHYACTKGLDLIARKYFSTANTTCPDGGGAP